MQSSKRHKLSGGFRPLSSSISTSFQDESRETPPIELTAYDIDVSNDDDPSNAPLHVRLRHPAIESHGDSQSTPSSTDKHPSESIYITVPAHTMPPEKHEAVKLLDHPPSRRRSLFAKAVADWWLLEIVCWLCAVGFTGGIVGILSQYDQKQTWEWPYSITINSSIALLSTLAKSSLMIPIASCLSQLKWARLTKKERKLLDLQTFDDASRGVLGCLGLLVTFKGGSV